MTTAMEILITSAKHHGLEVGGVSVLPYGESVTIGGKEVFISTLEQIGSMDDILEMLDEKIAPFLPDSVRA